MRRLPFVDVGAQYPELRDELMRALEEIFASGEFIGGEPVRRFEKEFAAVYGHAHCIGVGNGTDALRLALLALGIGPGDEVITAPNTFVATAEAIVQCGARPVFVDVHADTLLLDVDRLDAARTARTRAVVPVHLYGRIADMTPIANWCARWGAVLVEDAAQAHGARLGGRSAGSFGDAAGFSFYPSKNLGAAGDAGAVVTGRADIAERVRVLRDHGQSERYLHAMIGYNSRLDAIQAAVLSVKLRRQAKWTERRRALAAVYRERLEKIEAVRLLADPPEPDAHVRHLFVVRVPERTAFRHSLSAQGIETGLHYPVPIHLQPAFRHLDYPEGSFPVTETAAREIVSLPLYPEMTEDDVHRVADAVAAFFNR